MLLLLLPQATEAVGAFEHAPLKPAFISLPYHAARQRTCTPPGTSTTHLFLRSRRCMLGRVMGRMPHHQ